MSAKRLVLVGYPAEYFLPFGRDMDASGFDVHWICALHADAEFLRRSGVAESRLLDVTAGFEPAALDLDECRRTLSRFENPGDPTFNDIMLMDRLVSKKDWRFSARFLSHVAMNVDLFLRERQIDLASSWRDTAVQLTAMLVARRAGIPFVVPTRIRIPQEVYGFCTAHHTESFVKLRNTTDDDLVWAETFLSAFEARKLKPALKIAARNFTDVVRLVPQHVAAFASEFRRSFSDVGNDYTRYPISALLKMYVRRRVNMLLYKVARPAERAVDTERPYCLYALHTQPESSVDVQASFFSNQIELVRHVSRSLPSDQVLYVKVHPTDVDGKSLEYYRQILAIPNVVLVDHSVDSRNLLDRATIIFALTGTIAFEAALMRKQVIVFARNFFNGLPTVARCDSPALLKGMIAAALSATHSARDKSVRAVIVRWIADLRACCFDGEVSRVHEGIKTPLKATDLAALRLAYARLLDSVAGWRVAAADGRLNR